MGGIISTSDQIQDGLSFVSSLDADAEAREFKKSKSWNLYSENLDWAVVPLLSKKKEFSLGRQTSSDVVVSHNTTSGKHAIFTFDKDSNRWKCTDVGSSTGTQIASGSSYKNIQANEIQECPLSGGFLLGKCLITMIPSNFQNYMTLECIKGSLEGKSWRVPDSNKILACGESCENQIHVENSTIAPVVFQVYRYNGWFSISHIGMVEQNNTFINGKKIQPREMNFLWMGCEISITSPVEGKAQILTTFVVKCALKN